MYLSVKLFTLFFAWHAMFDVLQNHTAHKGTSLNKVISQFDLISFCLEARQII